ncbi:hypothetical protein A9Q83_12800 [Alphaproteobacteria bacterium 46_93_T64]|nr:hypothetical protein A9Q83_12800 [Alphaproteobacteria bacterium 46_93_T64]
MGQFEDMALFVKIVESGSITATANQLNLAKSAISRRLSELEGRLGVQLLTRTTRRSSLTEAGQMFYNQAQKILSDTEEMVASVSIAKSELSGTLKIAAPLSFGLKHLAPVVNSFAAAHPGLIIDLNFADHQINLVEEGVDLAIRIANLESSSLIARRFTTIRHRLYASPKYLETHTPLHHPSQFSDHKFLRYKSPSGMMYQVSDPSGEQFDLGGKTAMISNNGDFLRQAAIDGLGLCFSPTFICWEDLKSGALVEVLPKYKAVELGAYAIYPQTRYLSSRVRLFIDHLTANFGDTPYWDAA